MKRLFFIGYCLLLCSLFVAAQPQGFSMPQTNPTYKDVNYAGDDLEAHLMDIYLPETGLDKYKVIVTIYGSAWFSNNLKAFGYLSLGKPLVDAGFAVVSINHRSSGDAKFPAQINDVKAAIRFIRAHAAEYKLDTSFIGITGFSSGGHLSALAGVTNGMKTRTVGSMTVDIEGDVGGNLEFSSNVDAVVDWFGPVDMAHMENCETVKDGNSPEAALMGCAPASNPDLVALISPITYVNSNVPRFLVFHGEADNVVPHCQGVRFSEALKQAGRLEAFVSVPNGQHGPVTFNDDTFRQMTEFFLKEANPSTTARLTPTQPPFVYDRENTGAHFPKPAMPGYDDLPEIRTLPNALEGVSSFADWERRRNVIGAQIQHYGIGEKPAVSSESVKARMDGDTLIVDVTVNGQTLTLRSEIVYPQTGQPPYALMIGTSGIALPRQLFEGRPIATLVYHEKQVNDYGQWGPHHDRGEHNFDRLYPELTANGAYSEWAWGLSRLLDGLQQLGAEQTKIDMSHIGVTGCSYAGKMALYCGAFDERIALTIAQEPGGGGAAAWRVSHTLEEVESLDRTDYHWFLESQREQFAGDSVYHLPYDQHELCAMICPRALLLIGNPDYKWLADESMLVSAEAARHVWQKFGIADRMGWTIADGHMHCMLPEKQYAEVQAFIDRFLLGREADTNVTSNYSSIRPAEGKWIMDN